MTRIFCVEDEENIRELILYALKSSGFEALGFEEGEAFFNALKGELPELILLDIMLPDIEGTEILRRLRMNSHTAHIPVILLTAKDSELDKVKGLDLGADDYITKPFGVLELISRIKAVLRRSSPQSSDIITFKELIVNNKSRTVYAYGEEIVLTYKEFELLFYLLQNKGIVLSRDKIMDAIWGFDFQGETRTVDMHIKTLRQKLGTLGSIIETVRGVGYKIGG
ncbi:response regulator transcription factor [Alloiococcus sp. CFN-8]|uniref:response regulator transcription factor n=1 Tax=Alloiococcus sp. CFN-8 TaxID=3416081 RepID=UPI003CEA77F9